MPANQIGPELQRLIDLLAKMPGLGPRSAKRAALYLLKKRDPVMRPLAFALADAADKVKACSVCGNWDSIDPCAICADVTREKTVLCVVQDVGDLWALERAGAHRGAYHVLGGLLSPLDGVGPDDLHIGALIARVKEGAVKEVVLALPATVDGQTTAHYLADHLEGGGVSVTRLSQGVPVGGELDYLDEGTLSAAMKARRPA
ncbi:MAG TPA: recombination mediator RecR [Amphiplicatus sp.]|nr:recombination protein RecR [Caulobacterales bacterium]HOP20143.1 recombination mediator RecR [Amphiplicatus sp.]